MDPPCSKHICNVYKQSLHQSFLFSLSLCVSSITNDLYSFSFLVPKTTLDHITKTEAWLALSMLHLPQLAPLVPNLQGYPAEHFPPILKPQKPSIYVSELKKTWLSNKF